MSPDIKDMLNDVREAMDSVEAIWSAPTHDIEANCNQATMALRDLRGKLEAALTTEATSTDEPHAMAELRVFLSFRFGDDEQAKCEALDDIVHDLASQPASAINNGGLDEQIRYIVAQCGDGALATVREALDPGTCDICHKTLQHDDSRFCKQCVEKYKTDPADMI